MQVGKLGAAARKTMRPFFVWWVARCFLSVGLWGFGPVGQICKCSKYTSVYMYMYLCLFAKSWVFHGIQGNTPGAAPARLPIRVGAHACISPYVAPYARVHHATHSENERKAPGRPVPSRTAAARLSCWPTTTRARPLLHRVHYYCLRVDGISKGVPCTSSC